MHEVVYEDMVKYQRAVTRDALKFCGLGWDERCLTFFNTQRAVRTSSTLQVRKPMSDSSVGRWKRYRRHLEPLWRALGHSLEDPRFQCLTASSASSGDVVRQPNTSANPT